MGRDRTWLVWLIAVILVLGFAWMKAVGLQTIGLGFWRSAHLRDG